MSFKLFLRVDGIKAETIGGLEEWYYSYKDIDGEPPQELRRRVPALSRSMADKIKGLARTAVWAIAESPPLSKEDYKLIIGLAAINKSYEDLIPKKISPDYKEMVQAMITAVYTRKTEIAGIEVIDTKAAMEAFDVSEITIGRYLDGTSKPGYERLHGAIAMMAWDWKRSRSKETKKIKVAKVLGEVKELKEMIEEKIKDKGESQKVIKDLVKEFKEAGESPKEQEKKDRVYTRRLYTVKVTRITENIAEDTRSRTLILEPQDEIKCSKMQLKLGETPDKLIEDEIGHELDLGDAITIEITKSRLQSKLDIED
jgi:hypothetical protein